MRVLLDTHTLLWQLGHVSGGKLGPKAKQTLLDADMVYVSSTSLAEIHIKTMLGKLDAPEGMQEHVMKAGDVLLPFTADAADTLRGYPHLAQHDPYSRMLLAQAWAEKMTLMTTDRVLLGLGLDFVIDASK